MASAGTRSFELEKGVLLSETEENGIVTRTYIAPLIDPVLDENANPLAVHNEYPTPYSCPHCGTCIGSSRAFTIHLRACQRRLPAVDVDEERPAVPQLMCRSCNIEFESEQAYDAHVKLGKSDPLFRPWSKSTSGPFRCIFCRQEFVVPFELGQLRRRYACDECGRKARAKEADRQKKPKVKREAALSCNRCGKLYKLEGFLMRHQKLCQGSTVQRKREFGVHEVTKEKSKNESQEVAKKEKLEEEIYEVAEVKLESENHQVTKKIKCEDESQEVTVKKKREDESHVVPEVKEEAEIHEVPEIEREDECHELLNYYCEKFLSN